MEEIREIIEDIAAYKGVFGDSRDNFRFLCAEFLRNLKKCARDYTIRLMKAPSTNRIEFVTTYNQIKRDLLELLREETSQHYGITHKIIDITTETTIGRMIIHDSRCLK